MSAIVRFKHTLPLGAIFGVVIGLATESLAAVTISSKPTQNLSCVTGVCTPTAANAVLNVGDLTNLLASSNVQVNTGSGSLAQQVEDIVVSKSFSWASANSLTLDAYRSITLNAPIAANGAGAVALTTNDGGSGGTLSFGSSGSLSFLGTANSLAINGSAYLLVNTLASLASAVANNPAGAYAFAANYDATPDGTYSQSPVPTIFTGIFEGLGNTISNVTVRNAARGVESIGGLLAQVTAGTVKDIGLSTVKVDGYRASFVGGLVGTNTGGLLVGDHVSGNVANGDVVGGILGVNGGGNLDNSYAVVDVRSRQGGGGVVGVNEGRVSYCFAMGSVGGGPGSNPGGLAAANTYIISNSYATSSVTGGTSANIGGLVGDNEGEIDTSYSTGKATGGAQSKIGGFIGYDDFNTENASSYWDTTTSGTNQGTGNFGNVQGLTGLTTQQLQSGLPSGFDPTIWAENPKINHGFPYLIANPPPEK
ncbi:MAG TPA: hypothetical protein VII49_06890 [Rhizomicrobium sp.]